MHIETESFPEMDTVKILQYVILQNSKKNTGKGWLNPISSWDRKVTWFSRIQMGNTKRHSLEPSRHRLSHPWIPASGLRISPQVMLQTRGPLAVEKCFSVQPNYESKEGSIFPAIDDYLVKRIFWFGMSSCCFMFSVLFCKSKAGESDLTSWDFASLQKKLCSTWYSGLPLHAWNGKTNI